MTCRPSGASPRPPAGAAALRTAAAALATLAAVLTVGLHPAPARAQAPPDGDGVALLERGERQYRAGHFDSALVSFAAAHTRFRAAGDRARQAAALNQIGAIHARTGRPDSATAYLRPALTLLRALGDRAGEARALVNLGAAFQSTGRADSALATFRRALALQRAAGDSAGEAITLGNLGAVYALLGRADSAAAMLRRDGRRAEGVRDPGGEAAALTVRVEVLRRAGRVDSALVLQRRALALLRDAGDRAGEARALGNVGVLLLTLGRVDSALAYQRAALPILRAAGDRIGEAAALEGIGGVFLRQQAADSAAVYFRAAVERARAADDAAREAHALARLGEALHAQRGRLRALAVLDSAVARYAAVRMRAGGDANAVAFAQAERLAAVNWVSLWLSIARSRAVLQGDSGARAGLPPGRDVPTAAAALGAAERVRAQGLRDLLARSRAREAGAAREDGAADGAGATRWSRDSIPGGDLPAEADEAIAPLRRARTAVLSYFASDAAVIAWLLTPSGELRLTRPSVVPMDSIAALVATLRASLGADEARARMLRGTPAEQERAAGRAVAGSGSPASGAAAAASLAALLLLDELRDAVPTGTELVIVPAGPLALVPFAALVAPGDTSPLGARYALRFAPSLRALATAEGRPASRMGTRRALVVGDPAMPTVAASGGARAPLRPLPGARAEGAAVARRLGVAPHTGRAATESAVRDALPSAPVVHLATHGLAFADASRTRESYVALAPDADHDGLLTVGELLDDVPALAADIVVLSACQTGLGDVTDAEGTMGLQRALLARGARSVLVSQWSVDDRATALLMTRFYAHWLGPDRRPARSKAEALRRAQADVRARPAFAAPRHWAAFQLVGAP